MVSSVSSVSSASNGATGSGRTNQNDKAGPVTRAGQVLHDLLVDHKVCVVAVWSLRISWRTVTLFPEAQVFACKFGFGKKNRRGRRKEEDILVRKKEPKKYKILNTKMKQESFIQSSKQFQFRRRPPSDTHTLRTRLERMKSTWVTIPWESVATEGRRWLTLGRDYSSH